MPEQYRTRHFRKSGERRRYFELFALAPDGFLVTDPRGIVEEANPAAARLLRHAPVSLAGTPLAAYVPAGERRAFHDRLGQVAAGGVTARFELTLQPTDGAPFPAMATVGPLCDAEGTLRGLLWVVRDESERVESRRRLEESEARHRAIVETAVEGILTIDAEGTVLTMNPAATRIFGYAADEVIGRNVSMLMPAPWRDEHDGYLERYLRTREPRIIGAGREVEGLRKDGSTVALELSVSEFADDTGPSFVGVVRDLTEHRESEASLRLHQRMVSATEDLMSYVGTDYRYLAVNDAYRAAHGRPREEIIGHTVAEVMGESTFEETIRPHLDACLAGEAVHYEAWFELAGFGQRFLEVHYTPHRDESGAITGAVVDVRDHTEVKRLEDERAEQLDQLAHGSRLSTLGELASGLAHELNQPLAAIASYADGAKRLVRRGGIDPDTLVEVLEACAGQARRAGQIIRRMRSLVRREPGTRTLVDTGELVANVLPLVAGEAQRRRVDLREEVAPELPAVRADEIQIDQVVLNLVRNAIDAIDTAGSTRRVVTVCARSVPGGGVEVSVEDTGPGLDPDQGERLFDPFVTTKRDGLGMGLAICRSIVESHGGRLAAENLREGGAAFRFTLPAAASGSRDTA